MRSDTVVMIYVNVNKNAKLKILVVMDIFVNLSSLQNIISYEQHYRAGLGLDTCHIHGIF